MDVDKALKLKKLGVDFDDLSNDYRIDSNTQHLDVYKLPAAERWFIRDFRMFTSGVRGALAIVGDDGTLFKATDLQAPQFATIPLEINEWAVNTVNVVMENSEDIPHAVSYTFQIVRIPDAAKSEAVEVLLK